MTEEHIHKPFFKLQMTRFALGSSCVMIAIQIGFIILRWNTFPPKVPLFFSLPWGEEQLADTRYLWLFPLLSISILIVNSVLSIIFHHKESVLSTMFTISTAITILIATIGVLKIIFLLS